MLRTPRPAIKVGVGVLSGWLKGCSAAAAMRLSCQRFDAVACQGNDAKEEDEQSDAGDGHIPALTIQTVSDSGKDEDTPRDHAEERDEIANTAHQLAKDRGHWRGLTMVFLGRENPCDTGFEWDCSALGILG